MALKRIRSSEHRGTQSHGSGGPGADAGIEPIRVAACRRTARTRWRCSRSRTCTREPDLVPVRHGRMMVSPFTFYRGAAKIMAADLDGTPTAGLDVQLCGDAHLSNFGVFASPERTAAVRPERLRRDAAGPVRVRREADGGELHDRRAQQRVLRGGRAGGDAGVGNGLPGGDGGVRGDANDGHLVRPPGRGRDHARDPATVAEARSRRRSRSAGRGTEGRGEGGESRAAGGEERGEGREKARTRDSLQALSKLGELVDGRYRIVSQPPIVVPARDLAATYGMSPDEVGPMLRDQLRAYRATLQDDRRHLLERFEIVDMARKVVGVGSVGTRAFIVLLQGRDAGDPLFLQVKEATASVLEDHLPKSRYKHHGERVVRGQRMMQAASDIFLGWTKGVEVDRHFYWRQLRDMKGRSTWSRCTGRARCCMRASAGGPWPGRMPGQGTRSRSPNTCPTATHSIWRSPTSRSATRIRTSRTFRSS